MLTLMVLAIMTGHGQETGTKSFSYQIASSESRITIDGQLDEGIWSEVEVIGNFYQKFPKDSIPSTDRTEVMLTRDSTYLYVAARCYLGKGEKTQANTLFRDFPFFENDAFAVVIDPYRDGLNGFSFELTPYGSQGDRLISNGGIFDEEHSDYNWDNKWYSGVKIEENFWTLEIAIPFRTLRYNSGMESWGINFIRNNRSSNSTSSWYPIPVNFSIINLAYTGTLHWDNPPEGSQFRYSLIPSSTFTTNKDHTIAQNEWNTDFTPSLDFKVNFGTSLNLDGTINPDFSQIEVDQRQLNIGRFELSLPERRQFFIENSDLFAKFGNNSVRPFFSRRIGLIRTQNEVFEPVPILGGMRLSGKLGKNARIGAMTVQTDEDSFFDTENDSLVQLAGKNYIVGTYQQQLLERSTISALFINTHEVDGLFDFRANTFNHVYGAQFDWVSKNSRWNSSSFFFESGKPDNSAISFGMELNYGDPHFGFGTQFFHIDEGFNPDTGFVPRTGINQLNVGPFYTFRPENVKINFIDVFFDNSHTFSKDIKLLDSNIFTGTFFSFANTSNFLLAANPRYTELLGDFDPSFSGAEPLKAGSVHFYTSVRTRYRTDQRKVLSGSMEIDFGQYFNGTKFTSTNTFTVRWQPYFQFGLDLIYNAINLPEPYGDNDIFLIRPEARISFSENLFLTYISQYSSLLRSIGSNVRIQWRFKPASDIYLVYTDNYSDAFNILHRGFSIKAIYWL